jgi:hypothetical protein
VAAHVIDALLVGAEALHIGHVGSPDELPGAETIAHAADQLLRLGVGIVPDAAQKIVHTWLDPIEILTATAAIYILVVFAVSALGKALADLLRRRYGLAAS